MLVKAEGELKKNLIISTSRASSLNGPSNLTGCLIFYGRDLNAINSWLTAQKGRTVILEDEVVHRFVGHYEKMAYAKSELRDPLSFRHAGFGQNAVGAAADQDLAAAGLKGTMKAARALQSRAFIAYQGARDGADPGAPRLMHNQTDIQWVCTRKRGPDDRVLIDVSTGFLVLTEAAARAVIADPHASPAEKFSAKMDLYTRGKTW